MPFSVLIASDWFAPGFRAGGPIRSVVNLAELICDTAEVRVLSACRDLGEAEPYPGVAVNEWCSCRAGVWAFYGTFVGRLLGFRSIVHNQPPRAIYLNSMFSFPGTLWPLWLARNLPNSTRIVLAPRGMLKPSALNRKAWKKRPLLKLLRWSGLVRRVVFHATSEDELQEIEREFPGAKAVLIPNVPLRPLDQLPARPPADGVLRLCLVGRVHTIKNVHLAIEALAGFSGACELTIVGPEEDPAYAERCRKLAAGLPKGVAVRFAGALQEARIRELLIRADAMILPTQGENFGHAIFESLGVGTPVIISDRTIWRGLQEQQAGWDLPLEEPGMFAGAVRELGSMDLQARERLRAGALGLAQGFMRKNRFLEEYQRLFWGPLETL
ncbi:MAG: glycosyltransferase family 4 protein [Planctomycetaceae bacterium]